MKLVIFDVDGTLTNTQQIDQKTFSTVYKTLFDFDTDDIDWTDCPDYSDTGIAHFLFQMNFGRPAGPFELRRIKSRLIDAFLNAYEQEPNQFDEVQGASAFIEELSKNNEVKIAIATGCWEDSALFKLNVAGIDYEEIPLAHSDHAVSRIDIIQKAIDLSKQQYNTTSFSDILYFGDGEWDYKATKELNIPLIGIGANNSGKLNELGVEHIFSNYLDQARILELLVS